eukprot:1195601-Prorocentrum_minimum.AAC.1
MGEVLFDLCVTNSLSDMGLSAKHKHAAVLYTVVVLSLDLFTCKDTIHIYNVDTVRVQFAGENLHYVSTADIKTVGIALDGRNREFLLFTLAKLSLVCVCLQLSQTLSLVA